MTVSELIEKLKEMPGDSSVYVYDYDTSDCEIGNGGYVELTWEPRIGDATATIFDKDDFGMLTNPKHDPLGVLI